jgi:hypothetical protein
MEMDLGLLGFAKQEIEDALRSTTWAELHTQWRNRPYSFDPAKIDPVVLGKWQELVSNAFPAATCEACTARPRKLCQKGLLDVPDHYRIVGSDFHREVSSEVEMRTHLDMTRCNSFLRSAEMDHETELLEAGILPGVQEED